MKGLLLYLLLAFAFCQVTQGQTLVTFYTNYGEFVVEMTEELSPITSGNFMDLTEQEFYDGVIFHRIISNFVVQGGDPTGTGSGGPGYEIEDEFGPGLSNLQRSLSMANSGPNTGGSQFFINLVNNTFLDHDKEPLGSAHPVFGKVLTNWPTVQQIGIVATDGNDSPIEEVRMDSVRIRPAGNDIGAVAHWSMDNDSLLDLSGNFLNGNLMNVSSGSDRHDVADAALFFTGSGAGHFGDRYDELLVQEDANLSIAAWIYPIAHSGQNGIIAPIISKHLPSFCEDNKELFYLGLTSTGQVELKIAAAPDGGQFLRYRSAADIAPTYNWTHVAISYEGGLMNGGGADRVHLYINGEEQEMETTLEGELFNKCIENNLPLQVGAFGDGGTLFCSNSTFQGKMDELYLFNQVISQEVVNDLSDFGEGVGLINVDQEILNVYPNPSESGIFQLETESKTFDYQVVSLTGKKLREGSSKQSNIEISLQDFVPGVYLLNVQSAEGNWTQKLWKR